MGLKLRRFLRYKNTANDSKEKNDNGGAIDSIYGYV
jgi:hypothetical protein